MKLSDARNLAHELMNEFGLDNWTFGFDKAKRRFGVCKTSRKKISLSSHLTKLNTREEVEDTIRHEIAHALDYLDRGTSDHSYHWKKWARKVGAEPTRCYDSDEIETVPHKFFHYCPNCENKRGLYRRGRVTSVKSCGKCSRSFSPDFAIIPNIPAELMKRIEAGTLHWRDLPQAAQVVKRLERYYSSGLDESKFYKEFKGTQTVAAKKAKPNQTTSTMSKKKKSKKSKSTKEILAGYVKQGKFTREQITTLALEELSVSKSTISTYLSDGKNPKYNKFDKLIVEDDKGKLSFK